MACIRTRQRKDGKLSYQAIVRIAGQPELRETFKDKAKARAWCDAMSAAARASVDQMPDVKAFRRTSVKAALSDLSNHQLCPKSYLPFMPAIIQNIGDISLGNISQEYVLMYINKLRRTNSQFGRPFSDATILKHLTVIRAAVKLVAKTHRVKPDFSIYSVEEIEGNWNVERKRVLSADEEVSLRSAIATRRYAQSWELLIGLAIETSARESELALMELSEINFQSKVWTIPKEHTKMKYEREVPLSTKATAIVIKLRDLLELHNIEITESMEPSTPIERRLFYKFKSPSAVCTGFAKLIKATGVKDFHFHDLRHTAITRLTLNNRELEVHEIMRLAGHKTMEMFIRYSNYRAEDLVKRMG